MSQEITPDQIKFIGKSDYQDYIDEIIGLARHDLRIFEKCLDPAFNSSERHEALRRFLLSSQRNRLRIVVHDIGNIGRDCPRMLQLLRNFSHATAIHETQPQAKGVYDPFTIADESHSVRRFHFDELRGLYAKNDPVEAHTLVKRFEEIWEASSPAVTPTTLGL